MPARATDGRVPTARDGQGSELGPCLQGVVCLRPVVALGDISAQVAWLRNGVAVASLAGLLFRTFRPVCHLHTCVSRSMFARNTKDKDGRCAPGRN